MGGHYEGDGYELRGCDLALHFYRKARRRRGPSSVLQGGMVAPSSAPPTTTSALCRWCQRPLDALEVARDHLCRRCAADRDRAREAV